MRYTVFDIETPNRHNDRMSAIGITVIEDGGIAETFYSLVNPETYFDSFNVRLTGINESTVEDAPTFPDLWMQIRHYFSGNPLVAHNAAFDMRVLKRCIADYGLEWNGADVMCTVNIGRKILPNQSHKLNDLCGYYGINLDHHKADSDSTACAKILLHYIKSGCMVENYIKRYLVKN